MIVATSTQGARCNNNNNNNFEEVVDLGCFFEEDRSMIIEKQSNESTATFDPLMR